MQIVYGYSSDGDAMSLLDRFVDLGEIVRVKQLGPVGKGNIAFAALLSTNECFSFPFVWNGAHFVAPQHQLQSVDVLISSTSVNAQKKRFRKLNNLTVTPKNWKQHVSRNRGLKYASESLSS